MFSPNQTILQANDLRNYSPVLSTCNWYALYVKSRHEYVVQSELQRKKIETFLPSANKIRYWKDRKKMVDFPLFPGYLFVFISSNFEARRNVLQTRGAVSLLSTEAGSPTPVAPEEIHSLKRIIESGQEIDIYPHMKEGRAVKVRKGPLQGAEGIITHKLQQYIFVVNITILGRSISVNICAEDLNLA